ncbi:hypothetical protein ASZ90_018030 [hydrocarbon metagenome]|uniref:Uncharacterized protein n=1 Tax=hydrocarbon metagenome TaxID=938273 RepID=A0A0W8E7C1_9ZZZZ
MALNSFSGQADEHVIIFLLQDAKILKGKESIVYMNLLTISLVLFVVMILLAVVLLIKEKPWVKREKYPDGYWLGVGLGIGIGICMPIGLLIGMAMDNIPLGVAIGPALGAGAGSGMGSILEKKHRDPDQPYNEQDESLGKWLKKAAILILLLGVIIFCVLFMTRS